MASSRNRQCGRCLRIITNEKNFHSRRNLCVYCYDLLYESFACFDCFTPIERTRNSNLKHHQIVCDECRGQRKWKKANTSQQIEPTCLRIRFDCSKCFHIHNLKCPFTHTTDLNLPGSVRRLRQQSLVEYRSNDAISLTNVSMDDLSDDASPEDVRYFQNAKQTTNDGFYFWHRFLFCSYQCVRKIFTNVRHCAVCGEDKEKDFLRCRRCWIPLCLACSSQWFLEKDMCTQCWIDTNPIDSHDQLHQTIVESRSANFPQISNPAIQQTMLEFLITR